MVNEPELKAVVEDACNRFSVPGFLLLYLDGQKIKMTGNLTMNALMPFIVSALAQKVKS